MSRPLPTTLASAAIASVLALCSGAALAQQDYPVRPIRFVTTGAGGGLDYLARLISAGISPSLGQQVIVDNRPGSGTISGEVVARAAPDGYTFLLPGGTLWIGPYFESTPYDPIHDFTPITEIASSPLILVVNPSLPIHSVKDLIDVARAKPGVLNYSSSGTGSTSHLAAELFKASTDTHIVRIAYKAVSNELTDLLANQVQVSFGTAASVTPLVKAGKLRALAITALQPSALTPGLPPIAATVPGYEITTIYGLLAPAKLPTPIVNRMNQEVVKFVSQPQQKDKLLTNSLEVVGNTPEQFSAVIDSQMSKLGKLIKDVGIKAD